MRSSSPLGPAMAMLIGALACRGQSDDAHAASGPAHDDIPGMTSDDPQAAGAATTAMDGHPMGDLHMRMSSSRPPSHADSARAAALLARMRTTLASYRDVQVAERDGYAIFLPAVPQPVYHFTNWRRGLQARAAFDPDHPTSLLYRKRPDGGFELVGAMYTARGDAAEDELDRRVPLSVAHWHQHVNWCTPGPAARERWQETRDGLPLFGPRSPIAEARACESVGGVFHPRVFGWMVHVNAFAGDDPRQIWVGEEHAEATALR